MQDTDFAGRKAPYAPISALREFFTKMRSMSVPSRIDAQFLRKLNVASNNEYALLSALKFLGVVDERGKPTHSYRLLQTTDRFEETLRHLVESAYRPLLDAGGLTMSAEDLQNYFRVESSPSQAKNAARFFREVSQLADLRPGVTAQRNPLETGEEFPTPSAGTDVTVPSIPGPPLLLETKAKLLEKLPPPHPSWSAAEYAEICSMFLDMLRNLDGSIS